MMRLTVNKFRSSSEGYNMQTMGLDTTYPNAIAGLDAVREAMGDDVIPVEHGDGHAFYASQEAADADGEEQTRAIAYLVEDES